MMRWYFLRVALFLTYQQFSQTLVGGSCLKNDENDPKWRFAVFERKESGWLDLIHLPLTQFFLTER